LLSAYSDSNSLYPLIQIVTVTGFYFVPYTTFWILCRFIIADSNIYFMDFFSRFNYLAFVIYFYLKACYVDMDSAIL